MSENKIRVGITQGDINGIGLEVVLKTLVDPMVTEICTPVIFGSQKTIAFHRKVLGIEEINFHLLKETEQVHAKKVNLVNCYEEEVNIEMGKATEIGGRYALRSLQAACDALQQQKIDVLLTAPINKHTIQSDAFRFAGHTEYLESRFGSGNSLMLMVADDLRVGVVTGHIPLHQVTAALSIEKIHQKIKILQQTLIKDFTIRKPKIAVMGLNPHAGDQGTIGSEDQVIVAPAVKKAFDEGILAYGPYAADGFFGTGTYQQFDGVLAMYHDQGLVPFKALSFNNGVNYTAGLSIIRTSPDHGTAYEIAGRNMASESSFRKALYLALDTYRNRHQHAAISAEPLGFTPLKRER